jgi:hypothetical protein
MLESLVGWVLFISDWGVVPKPKQFKNESRNISV